MMINIKQILTFTRRIQKIYHKTNEMFIQSRKEYHNRNYEKSKELLDKIYRHDTFIYNKLIQEKNKNSDSNLENMFNELIINQVKNLNSILNLSLSLKDRGIQR